MPEFKSQDSYRRGASEEHGKLISVFWSSSGCLVALGACGNWCEILYALQKFLKMGVRSHQRKENYPGTAHALRFMI